jgi:hypothetical protein
MRLINEMPINSSMRVSRVFLKIFLPSRISVELDNLAPSHRTDPTGAIGLICIVFLKGR